MGLFVRCMLCLVAIAAHWANAGHDMVFEGPYVSKPTLDKMRRPVLVPKPVYRNPRVQPFPLVNPRKPPVPPPVRHPFYPMYQPNMPQTHYKHPWYHHGQFPPYWFNVPSPWYLKGHPFQHGPPYSVPKPAMQPPKPNMLTEKTVKPNPANVYFVKPTDVKGGYIRKEVRPQVPKYHGVKGGPAVYQAERGPMFDFSVHNHIPERLLLPHVPRYYYVRHNPYYVHPMLQWHPPQEPDYLETGRPVLQKKMVPRLEWSWEQGHWVPKFESS